MPPWDQPKLDKPNQALNIQFIPFVSPSNPDGQRSTKNRVREHVARLQHQRASYSQYSQNMRILDLTDDTEDPVPNAVSLTQRPDWVKDAKIYLPTDAGNAADGESIESADGTTNARQANNAELLFVLPRSPKGSAEEDPFWTYPIPYSPLAARVISHYMKHMIAPIPELDGPSDRNLLKTHWVPMTMQCSASFSAVILMAASHCRYELQAANSQSFIQEADILELRNCALQEVNRRFRSSTTVAAVSDAMIGAVAKLAVFEALFGDPHVFSQHMAGLRKMIGVRREMERDSTECGALDKFVARLVLWIDVNTAYFTGLPRTFVGDEHDLVSDVSIASADPIMFAGPARTKVLLDASEQST